MCEDPQAALRVLRDTVARYDAPTAPVDADAWESSLAAAAALPVLEFVPVDNAVALRAAALPDTLPRDPADRIIAATALGLGATLVTGDERLRRYRSLPMLWG